MTETEVALVDKIVPVKRLPGRWRISRIIDGRALRAKLTAAALQHEGDEKAARVQALDLLHTALFRGRLIAQERLQQGADGLDTARLLSAVQDEVLHALYDYTTTHVFRAHNPTEGERLAVFATGGYGRGVLAPSSDIDLLFIRPYKASAHAESVIEYMLYALWDMGLKVGHAFRTPQECVRLSADDVTIKTSLLDARFLFGDKDLANDTAELFNVQAVAGKDAQFIADKLAERDNRHTRQGDARYLVEPNVKEGKGGLRDLQTLFWIVKHMHPETVVSLEDVVKQQAFTQHESVIFMRAARFLWTVRCHLHYITGRPEERLSFDLQPELAERMGYRDRAGQLGVERFMKRYFLAAKDVGGLTRILAAKLEAEGKQPHWRFLLPNFEKSPFETRRTDVHFNDLMKGEQTVDLASMSDPILIRGDGTYLYTLPSVVDDSDMGVTHVIRGGDHVTNTGVQIAIFEALGAKAPQFGHHNLLQDASGEGLSKRKGALSIASLREDGLEPMAVSSLATLIGMSMDVEACDSLESLGELFDPQKVSKSDSKFNAEDLVALNEKLLHEMDYANAKPRLSAMDADLGETFWLTVRANISRFKDTAIWKDVVEGNFNQAEFDAEDAEFVARASALLPKGPWGDDVWKLWTSAVKQETGRKGKTLFMPLRLALTGLQHGPELANLLPLLGRERALARLTRQKA
ncbi:MAG: glutamate--tRNA ligase family protein [Henriciella sp.]|nr:glutamate--tRNA ligase family protein [Henriciella sp.]